MDAELFEVTEYFVAFKRHYYRGTVLRESDLAAWDVSKEDEEREVAKLLGTGKIDSVERAVPEPMPEVAEPVVDEHPVHEEQDR